MNLISGNYPIDMLDLDYFGLAEFFPDDDPELDLLTANELRVRDRETGAMVSLFGNFLIQEENIVGGTVNRFQWKTAGGEILLDFSNFSLPILQALDADSSIFLAGNDVITGSIGDDILLGLDGNDLVRGGRGNDLLIGLLGHDTLEGGDGDDTLIGADEAQWDASLFTVSLGLLSSSGEFVVFQAPANMLDDEAEPEQLAFYRGNLTTSVVERVVGPFENGDIFFTPVLSGDGSKLAFIAPVALAGSDESGYPQLLLADLDDGTITVVSRRADGQLAEYLPEAVSLSENGDTVAFAYLASDLTDDDTRGMRDIFIWRAGPGLIERVSVATDGSEADHASWFPSLSADGRLLAFASAAGNLTPQSTTGLPAVYVLDLESGKLQYVASLAIPNQFFNDIGPPPLALSANGRYLVFVSGASDLVADDNNGVADVFRRDLVSGETIRISVDSDGIEGFAASSQPAISGDGRYVAFLTASTWSDGFNDGNFRADVFIKDTFTELLVRIPVPDADAVGSPPPSIPQLSFNGSRLLFHYASNNTVLANLDESGLHSLLGQAGDDIYVLLRRESITETVNGGYDLIVALFSSDYGLPEHVEALIHPVEGAFEVRGNDLANRFLGDSGNETWNGAGGIDTLTLQVLFDSATISHSVDSISVSSEGTGNDRLISIERIEFLDVGLSLGSDNSTANAFALLYAGLNEIPPPDLLSTWMQQFDNGLTTIQVAQNILSHYGQQIPAGISDVTLVSTLWMNLVGSPITQTDLDDITGQISSGLLTQASLFAAASQHALNQSHIEPLIASGIFYEPVGFNWNFEAWEGLML